MKSIIHAFNNEFSSLFNTKVGLIFHNEDEYKLGSSIINKTINNHNALDFVFTLIKEDDSSFNYLYDLSNCHSIEEFIYNFEKELDLPKQRDYMLDDLIMLIYSFKYGYIVKKNEEVASYLLDKISSYTIDKYIEKSFEIYYGYNQEVIKEWLAIRYLFLANILEKCLLGHYSTTTIIYLSSFLIGVYRLNEGFNILEEYLSLLDDDKDKLHVTYYLVRELINHERFLKAKEILLSIKDINKDSDDTNSYYALLGIVLLNLNEDGTKECLNKVNELNVQYEEVCNDIVKIDFDSRKSLTETAIKLNDHEQEMLKILYSWCDKIIFISTYYHDVLMIKDIFNSPLSTDYTYIHLPEYYLKDEQAKEVELRLAFNLYKNIKDCSEPHLNEIKKTLTTNLRYLRGRYERRYFDIEIDYLMTGFYDDERAIIYQILKIAKDLYPDEFNDKYLAFKAKFGNLVDEKPYYYDENKNKEYLQKEAVVRKKYLVNKIVEYKKKYSSDSYNDKNNWDILSDEFLMLQDIYFNLYYEDKEKYRIDLIEIVTYRIEALARGNLNSLPFDLLSLRNELIKEEEKIYGNQDRLTDTCFIQNNE